MNQIFLELLNNAVVSSILIMVVMITRICIKKAPKWIACVLWGLVAIKLVLPFRIESMLSLIPSSKPILVDIEYQPVPQTTSGVTVMNDVVNPVPASDFTPNGAAPVNLMQVVVLAASVLWVIGMVILCMYFVVSFCLLRKRVAVSKNIFENVYVCDDVNSPFILGIIRPGIYLPSGMGEDTLECVLEHEKAHLKRLDHIWKPFGFLILTVYWFNPFCWIAYVLLCKDIEFACDELVTKDKDKEWKAAYCQALLDCSIKRKVIAACPVAFGEVSVKDRVKTVLHYKKPAVWLIVVAVLLSAAVAVCFMTTPKLDADGSETDMAVMETNKNISEAETEVTADDTREESENSGEPDEAAVFIAEKWAQAFCSGDGTTIVSMASQEVARQFEDMGVLERHGDDIYFSFGSSPMLTWPDKIIPYQIVSQDHSNHTVDIIYYARTSDPHVSVWREQIVLEPDADQYIIHKERLTYMDDIATAEEFLSAYPFGIRDTLMCYYQGNNMGEDLNNNALLSSGNYYKDLFDPATAAYGLLNIRNKENMLTEVETSGDKDSCGVKIYFPDGIIEISMCRPFGENGIWVPYDYSVVDTSENLLTMQKLVRFVTSKSWNQTQEEEGIVFWDQYENFLEDEAFHKDSLTGLRRLQLDYGGTLFELQVYYWPEDSAKKEDHSVGELDMIRLRNVKTDDAILLFSSDKRYTVNTDIESFLSKQYDLPEEILTGNECGALNGEISYSDYHVDMFLNFDGCLFENSNYKEPVHGEWTPRAWYALGGAGVCNDPNYESLETFVNGNLTRYQYIDNHMGSDVMIAFNAGEYSGCLYKYCMDLITAAETDLLKNGESGESEYWVVFFTKGQGEQLYMKFFNCGYYSQKDALESIANGTDIAVRDVIAE